MKYKKAWVIAVDMGYGHQRAAWPLLGVAEGGEIISANNYSGMPESDRRIWRDTRRIYDLISKFKQVPFIGDIAFGIFDRFQNIKDFYVLQKNVKPTFQLRQIYKLFLDKEWGKHLIVELSKKDIPLVTTFFAVAFMAEYWKYKKPIYLVVTDTDISRAWAPLSPKKTKIIYCASTSRVVERLMSYGVPSSKIVLTGFPLPKDLVKDSKAVLVKRILRLDPKNVYRDLYSPIVKKYLGTIPSRSTSPVSITFAIGGAGAQRQLAKNIIVGLAPLIRKKKIKLNLIAGTHENVTEYFNKVLKETRLSKLVFVLSAKTKKEYFPKFNKLINTTDILWTKPSELSFYASLGIPILMAPPIGSQEIQNRRWLLQSGAGINQLSPLVVNDWILDMINKGLFAEAAMQGFVELEREGAKNVEKLVLNK